ncbi:vanadium-dependent haloperoxidase [Anaeromicrobium sediminis]|uniref:Chloroperoxidase n=1 Tax=Anaeromicrobium sediminis TaxID=1478221 RepID=A0A267MG35_9FIRM|nr:vanadium-dependent haloperoxidase [Anaeromicrobium sediminis]PAB57760.1 chloroperoxidase [Anaeromicrobium sediminis]
MHDCNPIDKKVNVPRYWSQLSYAQEKRVPPAEDPTSGSWPTYFLKRDKFGKFIDDEGNTIAFAIRQPDSSIDFEGRQLDEVKKTLKYLTKRQELIATYWGTGPATKQWTPIIDILIDTYEITAPRAARILAATQGALNDAFAVAWYFKFRWNIARPNQLDQDLISYLPTPLHASYPSGHATVAGCAQIVLSYFFESESARLKELADQCAISRLYAGVHFPIDNSEGLRLGRQIGKLVVEQLDKQYDSDLSHIDYPILENRHAKLPPPPYTQVIQPAEETSYNRLDKIYGVSIKGNNSESNKE